jgi:hypothetical protein
MTLPAIDDPKPLPRVHRPVAVVAVIGGGCCLFALVVGLVLIGLHDQGVGQDAITALATIGGSLAGGFAGWIGRGASAERRSTDKEQP